LSDLDIYLYIYKRYILII